LSALGIGVCQRTGCRVYSEANTDPSSLRRRDGRLAPDGGVAMCELLLERALGWIDTHLGQFDPLWNRDEFDFSRGQRFGELAILARTVAFGKSTADSRIARILDLLRHTQSSPVFRDRLLRAPLELLLFLENHATLVAAGLDDDLMRARLQKAIRAGWLNQTERLPHRAMNIRWSLDQCGLEGDFPTLSDLYRHSILASPPSPILLSERDLYALTHVVMYVCDYGRRSPDLVPRDHLDALAASLGALVVVAARDRHWDLLAEFLLCWSCLELPESAVIEQGWAALERAQLPDGAVPGIEPTDGVSPFAHLYHTTLVSALAAAVRPRKRIRRDRTTAVKRADQHLAVTAGDEALEEVAERAAGWLGAVIEAECHKDVPSALRLSQGLLGLWCCSVLNGRPAEGLGRILLRLADTVVVDWPAVPPLLKFVAGAWGNRCDVHVPALHGESGFLRAASTLVERLPESIGPDALEIGEAWTALHSMDLAAPPPHASVADIESWFGQLALDSGASQFERALLCVQAWTASGTRTVRPHGVTEWLPDLMAGLLVHACRRYNLMEASSLLRAASWITEPESHAHRVLHICASYLVFNQREDGAFGFIGPELAKRRQEMGAEASGNDCCLALTASCLVALTETFRPWRLLRDLRAPGESTNRPRSALLTGVLD
jgi:hypothetical protein